MSNDVRSHNTTPVKRGRFLPHVAFVWGIALLIAVLTQAWTVTTVLVALAIPVAWVKFTNPGYLPASKPRRRRIRR